MNTTEFAVIQTRCLEFVKTTRFKCNCDYSDEETVESAFDKAMGGFDNGINGMAKIMPNGTDMKEWLDYFFLCYYLYRHCK